MIRTGVSADKEMYLEKMRSTKNKIMPYRSCTYTGPDTYHLKKKYVSEMFLREKHGSETIRETEISVLQLRHRTRRVIFNKTSADILYGEFYRVPRMGRCVSSSNE